MFNCTISISENSQLTANFVSDLEYDICEDVTIDGYKLCITDKRFDGLYWNYSAVTCPDIDYDIVSPHKGNVTLSTLLTRLSEDIDVSLNTTAISGYIPLSSIVYSNLLSQGTIKDVLSNLCDIYRLSWWLYWSEDSLLPVLMLTYKARTSPIVPPYILQQSKTYNFAATPYLSVITLPEVTASDCTVLGDGTVDFEPATEEFTVPHLVGTSVPLATVKEIDETTGEEIDVPFDQWRMLKRELAISGTTWYQKSPIGKWTQEQRNYNKSVKESADLWPMYWVVEDGLTRELPPEGKVKIIETELDHTRQTRAQALADYPKLTYILPGKIDVWSWVGVWPDVNRYDTRTMPEHYNYVRVWRGDKKNNRQPDWGEETV